ncbi:hypothetical protein [Amycolatopsis sp. NBC_01480]|uniref:hypothetical protein n=1 Tax=Amycolatopsis sp. NBC_01480 TaxID=2903562 RepID=UPI002E2C91AF|nr:hypothetical protein [Amycolatopsis sp. NBC_01480]
MKRTIARVLLPLAVAGAFAALAGGVADAAPAAPAPDSPALPSLPTAGLPALPTGDGTAIWALPGVDLGGLLGPTVQAPTELLAPLFNLITPIS